MNGNRPTILFERGVPWQTIYPVSTRVLAEQFARDGWNVVWLTPPLKPWQLKARGWDREQALAQHRQQGLCYGNVFAYTPRTLVPSSSRFPLDRPFLVRLKWRVCVPSVRRVLRRRGVPAPDVLWLGSFHAGGLRRLFPGTPTIFHVTDAFRHYATSPATCVQLERENYGAADHVVVTAPSLKSLLVQDFGVPADRVSVVVHGVDLERFADRREHPDPLAGCPHPRLVALGNTSKLDLGILARLAGSEHVGTVAVVGPETGELREMARRLPALRLVGALLPDQVPNYLLHCDVGLVLFGGHVRGVAQYACPMKLFEYAAAGLPVVSTPLPIYEALDAPVLVARTPQESVELVRRALADAERLGAAMRAFAERNTWARRYEEALRVVEGVRGVGDARRLCQ